MKALSCILALLAWAAHSAQAVEFMTPTSLNTATSTLIRRGKKDNSCTEMAGNIFTGFSAVTLNVPAGNSPHFHRTRVIKSVSP